MRRRWGWSLRRSLDRTTSGSSSVDEENVEVELESEPVCRGYAEADACGVRPVGVERVWYLEKDRVYGR